MVIWHVRCSGRSLNVLGLQALPATLKAREIKDKEGILEKQGGGTSIFGSKGWKRR